MDAEASAEPRGALTVPGLGAQVRSTVGRLYRRFRSERPEGGLGDAALDVLNWLHKTGPQTLTELSEVAQVTPASMSQSVNRLTSAGYVVRTPDPGDRRKVLFRTTPEGARLAETTRARRDAWLEGRLGALSPEDQQVVARACAILATISDS
ncbi:MarR family winged helix-turn-helix transcriptional regulator [Leifsonia sp. 21MFCrub1.1]|uniref:MarR family winged helix-turn-helix transcriptional regulator n=1 Tax=Leifsonia sp. 21MFCrub1.1 TaxID=1798223 RepID=UPI0008928E06|nr:MarR family transcriptional regulator [Leifsonia sp. 21MFCrub1.1]SEA61352.1 DNA-binding transcriptional regulator, MarR family [Leifsonia sp. 21MFCrub1.1]